MSFLIGICRWGQGHGITGASPPSVASAGPTRAFNRRFPPHGLFASILPGGSGATADPLRCAAHKRIEPGKEQGVMRTGRWQIGVTLGLMLSGAIASAAAQELVRAPERLRGCLCQERSVGALNAEVQTQSRAYEEKRQAFQALDKQVQTTRPSVNVANQGDVDAFKRLLERRDRAADALASDATKTYSDAVARYNQAVAAYNGTCSGKAYDPDQLAELRRSLSCAKQ
jgi:hypothetical protein